MHVSDLERVNTVTAVHLLRLMLALEGIEVPDMEEKQAWPIFKKFAALPGESDSDIVGYQVTRYEGSEGMIECLWIRQLTDDVYLPQLNRSVYIQFNYNISPTIPITDVEIWADQFESLDAFFGHVEGYPQLQGRLGEPGMVDVYAEDKED
jgi:hypothetical protein